MLIETILGGLTGLFGNMLTSWTSYQSQKLKNIHDEKMYDFKIREITSNTDAAVKIANANISGAIEIADAKSYDKSQEVGNQKMFGDSWIERLFSVKGYLRYFSVTVAVILAVLLGCVDFLKGLMRPGITIYLIGVTTWITVRSYELLQKSGTVLDSTQSLEVYNEITSIVVYLTVSCVTWWFGDRRMAKFTTRLNKQPSISTISDSNILPVYTQTEQEQTPEKPGQISRPCPNDGVIPK